MKIFLFKTEENNQALNSFKLSSQFFPGSLEIYSNYEMALPKSEKDIHIEDFHNQDELFKILEEQSEPCLIATSATVFSAECLIGVSGAYEHFSQQFGSAIIQPTFDNDLLGVVSPSLMLYGDRHIYCTGSRITNPFPILYGASSTISDILKRITNTVESNTPLFTDGIFHGGQTVILSPLPPMAWNLEKPLPALVSSAEFDAETYINNIPNLGE